MIQLWGLTRSMETRHNTVLRRRWDVMIAYVKIEFVPPVRPSQEASLWGCKGRLEQKLGDLPARDALAHPIEFP